MSEDKRSVRFRATVGLGGKTATGTEVPEEVLARLGPGKRPAVSVTVGGYTYRTTVGSTTERAMLPLNAENRGAADVAAGHEVEVEVTLDLAPRVVEVPKDLAALLSADSAARAAFDDLAPGQRKERVRRVTEPSGPRPARTASRRPSRRVRPPGRRRRCAGRPGRAAPARLGPRPGLRVDGTGRHRSAGARSAPRVLRAGETVTHAELARRSGTGVPARSVGSILAANPVPLVIPCHRVVAADGLGGFSGGDRGHERETKRWLLELEGARPPVLV